jgi:hypothetical protein
LIAGQQGDTHTTPIYERKVKLPILFLGGYKMKDVILDYLTNQCLKDDFLKKHFDKAKIDGCIEHLNAEARKVIKGKSGYIADEVVFKWARDYFVDEIYLGKTQETKQQVEEVVQEEVEEKKEPDQKTIKKSKKTVSVLQKETEEDKLLQLELFDFGDE